MKYIQKIKNGKGYRKLLNIHKAQGSYEDTQDNKKTNITTRTDILNDLLTEQNGICAYCMRSINLKNATIEHIIGQSYIDKKGKKVGKEQDTNYDNMLAVCQGKYCLNNTHCDSSRSKYQKNNPLLSLSPLNKQQMNRIKFTQSGVIYYEEIDKDSTQNKDLDRILNLNCDAIKESRSRILHIVISTLIKHNFNSKFAQKELEYWENKNNPYRAYCQVAIFTLKKYIKKKGE
jgi:uncharacterized protein (TIGR02646 family)